MKRSVCTAVIILFMMSCSSSKPKMVSDHLDEVKSKVGDKEIGYNDGEKNPVIQQSVAVENELREMTWKNFELDRKLRAERADLIHCRTDLADPRLGGKELGPVPEIELAEDTGKIKEKIGLTKGDQIKIVRQQGLEEKLQAQRNYHESLEQLIATISKYNTECQRELRHARVQAGLPAEKSKAEGHYDAQGHFVVDQQAEKNLDDAFKRAHGRKPASNEEEEQ